MWKRRTLITLVLLLCTRCRLTAQDPLAIFTPATWRIQNGLRDQVVQAIVQTPDHFLWIGTSSGLVRFDGSNFLPYRGAGAEALRRGVTALVTTADGSLYAGTDGAGLVRFRDGEVRIYTAADGLKDNLVRALLEDRSHRLWVATDHGLYRSAGDRFQDAAPHGQLPHIASASLLLAADGAVWSGGNQLVRFEQNGWKDIPFPVRNGAMRIKSLAFDRKGNLWVGAVSGLYRSQPGGPLQKVPQVPGSVRILGRLPMGELWAGTAGNGMYSQIEGIFRPSSISEGLPSQTILSQALDNEGNVWLGTQGGLVRLSQTSVRTVAIPRSAADSGAVMRDADDTLWWCSNHVFRLRHGKIDAVHFPGIESTRILAIMREKEGALWIATAGSGAYRLAPGARPQHFTQSLGINYIRGFLQARDHSVWIATDGGIGHYIDGRIVNLHRVGNAPHTTVLALAEDPRHGLWVGTQHGLYLFRDGKYASTPQPFSLPDSSVTALHLAEDRSLWIGASSGLYRLKNGALRRVPLQMDGQESAITQILETPSHFFWIATAVRVERMSAADLENAANTHATPENGKTDIFSISDDLPGTEIFSGMQPGAALDATGEGVWLPSSQGPLHLSPELRRAGQAPAMLLSAVHVDGRAVSVQGTLRLPPGTKTVQIDYAPLMLSSQSETMFERQLEGFDPATLTRSRSAIYTNLPPGTFRFRVASHLSGSDVTGVTYLTIEQLPWFYQQISFWAAILALCTLCTWLLYRRRITQIHKEFRLVTDERTRLAREMHDTVIQGCTAVSALLEAVEGAPPETSWSSGLLRVAREQIRTTIDEARAAVWNLRCPEQHVLSTALNDMLHGNIDGMGIRHTFQRHGAEPTLAPEITHALLMSTREALINAALHSSATRIDLELKSSNDELAICIKDNGKGFSASSAIGQNGHFGLIGMKERLENIGGAFSIECPPGRGTIVSLRYPHGRRPNQQEHSNEPTDPYSDRR